MDSVVGFAFGGPAKLTSEQGDVLGADRASCSGEMNLGAAGLGNNMERLPLGVGVTSRRRVSTFFLDLFIPNQPLSKKVL